MRQHFAAAAFAAALGLSLAAPARAQDAHRLTLTTERVVVFKDGYCMVVKRAVGTSDDAGEVFTDDVPDAAVLGSFWATPERGRLVAMTAGVEQVETETEEERDCAQILELLSVNEGKTVTVDLEDGSNLTGTIRRVLTREQPQPAAPPPWRSGRALPTSDLRRETTVLAGSLFVLRTGDRDVVLPVGHVRRLATAELALRIHQTTRETRTRKRLTFRFEGGAEERALHLVYFRPGVRWIPTYRLDLAGGDDAARRARVRLQAEILNEAEDLVDVPFDLVVGVPNFRFKEVVSPFVLEAALRDALRQAAPQLMGQSMSNAAFSNRAGEYRGRADAPLGPGGAADLPEEITAGRSQDLFVYGLPRLTLRRGERAAVPVFEADAPYRDVYTWDLTLSRRDIATAPSGAGASPLALSQNLIWHQVELVNATGVPWTTGAALLLDGHQPLAQELLTYTSPGARVRIPVTVAVELRGTYTEEETGRDLGALKFQLQEYARIDQRGTLSVTSHAAHAVDLEITCGLGGRADATSLGGEVTLGAFRAEDWVGYGGHPAVNNHSDVRWDLRLAPGETASPEVRYHYFTLR